MVWDLLAAWAEGMVRWLVVVGAKGTARCVLLGDG